MKLVFMGTPDFAVPCLRRLVQAGHTVLGVFSQPDKPKGRGYALAPPPVKEAALALGLPVFQPAALKSGEALEQMQALNPEVIVVAAYGKILPPQWIHFPEYGCLNVHASLLPKYRGAAPIQWAVLHGEEESGVTIMQMEEGLDTGDMLLVRKTAIGPEETAAQLFGRLSELGAEALLEALEKLEAGALHPVPQEESRSTYAPMISKKLCPIDWNRTAQEIHNQVRGLAEWPVAATRFQGKNLKIHAARIADPFGGAPGTLCFSGRRWFVACGGNTALELLEVQLEGKKRMGAEEFLRGHPLEGDACFERTSEGSWF